MKKATLIEGFWDRFEEVVTEDGRTKAELAKLVGCHRKTLYSRASVPSPVYLARFCAITGTSADYLLGLRRTK